MTFFVNYVVHEFLNFTFFTEGGKGSSGDKGSQGEKGQQGLKGMPGTCDAKVILFQTSTNTTLFTCLLNLPVAKLRT